MSLATSSLIPSNLQAELTGYVTTITANVHVVITPAVIASAKSISFNPFFWNVVGRVESKTGLLTKLTGGKKYVACYIFAVTVFSLGIFRDYLYFKALQSQPTSQILANTATKCAGILSAGVGNILVLSSMWKLGITGTYLGDYFGILMPRRIESFPFNIVNNPMYVGSFLTFLGVALFEGKVVGIALSLLVWLIYRIGLLLEEPFTEKIYNEKIYKLD